MNAENLAELTQQLTNAILQRKAARRLGEDIGSNFSAVASNLDGSLLSDIPQKAAQAIKKQGAFTPEGEWIEAAARHPVDVVTSLPGTKWGEDIVINNLAPDGSSPEYQFVLPETSRTLKEVPAPEHLTSSLWTKARSSDRITAAAADGQIELTPEQIEQIKKTSSQMDLEEMSLQEIEERLAALALKEAGKKQQLPVLTIEDIAASRSNQLQLTDAEQAIFDAQQQELALAAQALEEAKVKSKQSDIADISPTDDKPLPEENVRRSPKERTNRFGEYFRPVYDYVGEHPLISIAGTGAALGMGAVALNQARQGEEQTFEEPFYEPTPVGAMPASFSPRWA